MVMEGQWMDLNLDAVKVDVTAAQGSRSCSGFYMDFNAPIEILSCNFWRDLSSSLIRRFIRQTY